jgi:hypothetical protein
MNNFRKYLIRDVITLIFFCLLLAIILECSKEVTEPSSVQFSVRVGVTDTSYVTTGIFRQTGVPGAEVSLFSVNYGLEFISTSDNTGLASFENLIPDLYNCSVKRIYPEDTVQLYLGYRREEVLVGSKAAHKMGAATDSFSVLLKQVPRTPFIISEIYYNGAPPPPPLYFHDQFTEIYNNSSVTEYLDGMVIGDADYGYKEDPDFMYSIHLYQFPGSGTDYPVAPGQTVIIAQDADNHLLKNTNSFDLSQADFEYFNPLSNDIDNPFVPNMIQLHHKYGIDFLYSVFNDAIYLARLEPEDTLSYGPFDLIKVPKKRVWDGVEYKEDVTNYEFKRLSDDIDAGITGGLPGYQGKSIARRVFKVVEGLKVLMDNNNSSIDFQVLDTPSPGSIE